MSSTARRTLVLALGVLLLACKREAPPEEQVQEEQPDTAAMEATISLADVAGRWNVRVMPETGDSTLVEFELNATAESWTQVFPARDPIPIRIVAVEGDSIMTEAGPFESVLYPGVQVSVEGVWRLEGDRLVAKTVAHYQTTDPDSVRYLRAEATRAP